MYLSLTPGSLDLWKALILSEIVRKILIIWSYVYFFLREREFVMFTRFSEKDINLIVNITWPPGSRPCIEDFTYLISLNPNEGKIFAPC